jgi:hypothetical protein
VGTIVGFTVIVNVVVDAHCPAEGVKVYVVVAWLFKAGDHVPVIPFKDEVGNAVKFPP